MFFAGGGTNVLNGGRPVLYLSQCGSSRVFMFIRGVLVLVSVTKRSVKGRQFYVKSGGEILVTFPRGAKGVQYRSVYSIFSTGALVRFIYKRGSPIIGVPSRSTSFLRIFFSVNATSRFSTQDRRALGFTTCDESVFAMGGRVIYGSRVGTSIFVEGSYAIGYLRKGATIFTSSDASNVAGRSK